MAFKISARLEAACRQTAATTTWLEQLPESVSELARRWRLTLGEPFDGEDGGCAWVAPATRSEGTLVVLKLGMPHFEAEHEVEGLRFWSGNPTVQLLDSDDALGAMLLERCLPGTSLRALPQPDQDVEVARLMRRLWRTPPPGHRFRPLSAMLTLWTEEAVARRARWRDAGLVDEGLRLFGELSRGGASSVLLATDLHAGNVLRAERERWLVIDPKPFVGDPAYDATQHLLNCRSRLLADPGDTILRFAELLQVDHERVRLWTFARAAVEAGGESPHSSAEALARALEP
jgi:streptomycin 6-kinase